MKSRSQQHPQSTTTSALQPNHPQQQQQQSSLSSASSESSNTISLRVVVLATVLMLVVITYARSMRFEAAHFEGGKAAALPHQTPYSRRGSPQGNKKNTTARTKPPQLAQQEQADGAAAPLEITRPPGEDEEEERREAVATYTCKSRCYETALQQEEQLLELLSAMAPSQQSKEEEGSGEGVAPENQLHQNDPPEGPEEQKKKRQALAERYQHSVGMWLDDCYDNCTHALRHNKKQFLDKYNALHLMEVEKKEMEKLKAEEAKLQRLIQQEERAAEQARRADKAADEAQAQIHFQRAALSRLHEFIRGERGAQVDAGRNHNPEHRSLKEEEDGGQRRAGGEQFPATVYPKNVLDSVVNEKDDEDDRLKELQKRKKALQDQQLLMQDRIKDSSKRDKALAKEKAKNREEKLVHVKNLVEHHEEASEEYIRARRDIIRNHKHQQPKMENVADGGERGRFHNREEGGPALLGDEPQTATAPPYVPEKAEDKELALRLRAIRMRHAENHLGRDEIDGPAEGAGPLAPTGDDPEDQHTQKPRRIFQRIGGGNAAKIGDEDFGIVHHAALDGMDLDRKALEKGGRIQGKLVPESADQKALLEEDDDGGPQPPPRRKISVG